MASRQGRAAASYGVRLPAVSPRTARRAMIFIIVLGIAYLSGRIFALLAAAYIAWRIA